MRMSLDHDLLTFEDSATPVRSVVLVAFLIFGGLAVQQIITSGNWPIIILFSAFCCLSFWSILSICQSKVVVDSKEQRIRINRSTLVRATSETYSFATIRSIQAVESKWGGEGAPSWNIWLELEGKRKVKLFKITQKPAEARQSARVIEKMVWPNA
jgi:hypothetical protein